MKIKSLNTIRITVLLIGLTLCVLGIIRSELTEIMQKANFICLECIGIG